MCVCVCVTSSQKNTSFYSKNLYTFCCINLVILVISHVNSVCFVYQKNSNALEILFLE